MLLLANDRFIDLLDKFEGALIYKLDKKMLLNDKLLNEIQDLKKYLDTKRKRRNDIIHSLWKSDEKGKIVSSKVLKKANNKKELIEEKPINLKDLEIFAKELSDAGRRLLDFKEKIITLLST